MRTAIWSLVLAAPAFFAGSSVYADGPALPDDGVRVLLRGPIHEAFAQPVNLTPVPGPVVPRQPPDPIAEIPPDERPGGDTVVWIPGYWSWDSDTANFIWVSGFWRMPPPGRQWVPGYWTPVAGGWQWVSGYWAVRGLNALLLGAVPPASLEAGPAIAAPDGVSMYVPGCWLWNQDRYAWRPGYWTPGQADWVWTPAQYRWTPAGYNFVDGFWDFPLERRGMLLAPVAFDRPVFAAPGWRFRPSFAVNLAGLFGSLFIRPAYCSYYFGDYYGPECLRAGFQPWCVFGPRCFDPLFTYCWWSHRDFPDWQAGLLRQYDGRVKGEIPRPPRTVALQDKIIGEHGGDPRLLHNTSDIVRKDARNNDVLLQHMLTPLGQIKRVEGRDIPFAKLSPAERDRFAESAKEFRKIADARRVSEKPGADVRRLETRVEDHRTPNVVTGKATPEIRISNASGTVKTAPATVNIPAVHPTAPTVVTRPTTSPSVASPAHSTMPEHTTTPTHTTTPPAHTVTPAHPATPTHTTTPGTKSPSNPATHQQTTPKQTSNAVRTANPARTTTTRTTTTRSTPRTATTRSTPARSTPARSTTSRAPSRSSSPARSSGSKGSSGGHTGGGHK